MTARPVETAALVERVRGGDGEAARRLVERCHLLVLRIVRAHRPRSTSEEDLAQEVYLKMFARLDRYEARAGVPFEHWLARLAVWTCRDALRSESRRPLGRTAGLSEEARAWLFSLIEDRAPSPEHALAAREAADALLALLPAPDRLILTLLDLEDREAAEAAALLGWSTTRVRVRAFRARRRLREAARTILSAAQEGGR
jgi:RNA polymerase sigma-70 factor (ECF subfamily)